MVVVEIQVTSPASEYNRSLYLEHVYPKLFVHSISADIPQSFPRDVALAAIGNMLCRFFKMPAQVNKDKNEISTLSPCCAAP